MTKKKVVTGKKTAASTAKTTAKTTVAKKANAKKTATVKSKKTVAATTKTAAVKPPADSTTAQRTAEVIPIDQIEIKKNIRRAEITPENDPKITELAENIKQVGILQPLVVSELRGSKLLALPVSMKSLTALFLHRLRFGQFLPYYF